MYIVDVKDASVASQNNQYANMILSHLFSDNQDVCFIVFSVSPWLPVG